MEENSHLYHMGKNNLLKPQNRGPFLPIRPNNTQMHSRYGEGKETTSKLWRRDLSLFLLREGANTP